MQPEIDISVIIAAHNEGCLAHRTIASLFRAINFAKEHNLRIEPVVILDKADNKTIKYFDRYKNSEIRYFS